jgi:hypothetical protein
MKFPREKIKQPREVNSRSADVLVGSNVARSESAGIFTKPQCVMAAGIPMAGTNMVLDDGDTARRADVAAPETRFHPIPARQAGAVRKRRNAAGFTLAEVLAALVFMAILIPVAIECLSIAGRAGEVAVRKNEASLVAERILNENIVTTNWNRSTQSGSVQQGIREFRWTLRNDPWNQDPNQNAMRLVSVEVTFTAQGRDYPVRMSTLVDSTLPLADTSNTSTNQ